MLAISHQPLTEIIPCLKRFPSSHRLESFEGFVFSWFRLCRRPRRQDHPLTLLIKERCVANVAKFPRPFTSSIVIPTGATMRYQCSVSGYRVDKTFSMPPFSITSQHIMPSEEKIPSNKNCTPRVCLVSTIALSIAIWNTCSPTLPTSGTHTSRLVSLSASTIN
ncbi:hypothetical protein KIN20_016527 [Parelaphostrongylus tenuis]|uniref:Uncharacterized protein n=1 Tax=Parelaphostrongylus tenuis TaxID=148309 RepID=A0AAD5MLR9_PARTN|nr:hypothetical protein KIN20_016527 [Parelaphostrongylus tenuis]